MELIPFIAHSANDAVSQIQQQLGPNAVVVHVRPLPAAGLRRLFQKPRFEILAYRPENPPSSAKLDLRSDAPALPAEPSPAPTENQPEPVPDFAPPPNGTPTTKESWQIGHVLQQAGFLPLNAQRVVDRLQQLHGTTANRPLNEEIQLAANVLKQLWRHPPALIQDSLRPHVFVGPPASGKTTVLAKWLTQTVLLENRPAQVWRLDHRVANTAESLELHCQALGVPCSRSWNVQESSTHTTHFIDLPGSNWRDPKSLQDLAQSLRQFLSPHVHLVLNAAYDTQLLLAQTRAFACLPIEDLVLTHLDEESRLGKVWNLTLGTNFPIRFLSAGQNIPGDFAPASAEQLIARHLSR